MAAVTLMQTESIVVIDYRCTARPGDRPFAESHAAFSASYVRKGSFGCNVRGQVFELVAGSVLVGHPGDEYLCTHDHHVCGDECTSFQFSPAFAEALGGGVLPWKTGGT